MGFKGNPAAQAAARAIVQSASTMHLAGHCIALPLYGAVSAAYDELGASAPWEQVEKKAADESFKMFKALVNISVEYELNPAKINWKC
jgi:hypothetical protein